MIISNCIIIVSLLSRIIELISKYYYSYFILVESFHPIQELR